VGNVENESGVAVAIEKERDTQIAISSGWIVLAMMRALVV